MSVCVCVCVCVLSYLKSSPDFLRMFPVTVTRSSSGGVATRYVLPVLWMTPSFHIVDPMAASKVTYGLTLLLLVTHIPFYMCSKKSESNLGRAASPPLTAENNYDTKSPLITMERPTFTSKTVLSPSTISTQSNTLILAVPSTSPPHTHLYTCRPCDVIVVVDERQPMIAAGKPFRSGCTNLS